MRTGEIMQQSELGGQTNNVYQIREGEGSFSICLQAFSLDNGFIIHITGGDTPHIGGVAVGLPRPSTEDPSRTTANVSVISILGHKDDELARPIADRLVRVLKSTIVVIAGIHVHNATRQDIERIVSLANQAVERLLEQLKGQQVSH